MKIIGTIHEIEQTEEVSASFRKRLFVLEHAENPQYPQFILFELVQDCVSLLDDINVGQEVEVSFNIKGRKWSKSGERIKYINSLHAYRIDKKT